MMFLISLALLAAPSAQKSDAGERASDPQDKMICKRFVETGSLVKGTRVCKTKREWERERENVRATTSPQSGSCNASGLGGGC